MMTNRLLSLALALAALGASAQQLPTVPWRAVTSNVTSTRAGDPTLLSMPLPDGGPVVDLVLGTDLAQVGVYAWSTDGALRQVLATGIVSSADSRGRVVVATQPGGNLLLLSLGEDGGLGSLSASTLSVPSPSHAALRELGDGGYELWLDTSSPTLQKYTLSFPPNGSPVLTSIGPAYVVPERPAGLAVDDRSGRLYVSQPNLGVVTIETDGTTDFLLSIDGGELGDGLGGIDLFPAADGRTFLFTAVPASELVSVHVVPQSGTPTFGGQFHVGAPDGGNARAALPSFLDVMERPFGAPDGGFERGALVVQDGVVGDYKLVALADVDAVVPLPPAWIRGGSGGGGGGTGGGGGFGGGGGGSGGGSSVAGGSGNPSPTPPSVPKNPVGCGCGEAPLVFLPALALLWWIRRSRS